MRTALLFATLALLGTAALAEEKPARPESAPAAQTPAPEKPAAAAAAKPAEESPPAPDTGVVSTVNVQGNRRVEADAIRAQVPIKPGDTYDKEKIRATLMAVWRMGYFSDAKVDVSPAQAPLTGYTLTVIVTEKP